MRLLLRLMVVGAALGRGGAAAAAGQPITVPVDVGVGPAAYVITGRVAADQPVHPGLKISVQAIIDQATLQQHQDRIPPRMRKQVLQMKEVRFSPSIFIPDAIIIAPPVQHTAIYGVTWRPLSLGLPLVDTGSTRLRVAAGLLLTYAYITSELPRIPTTHFFRPGLDLGADLEVALSPSFLISFGWASGLYIPQVLGGFGTGRRSDGQSTVPVQDTLWHFGQAYLKLHFRFPYTTKM